MLKAGGPFGAGYACPQAGQMPEEKNNGIHLNLTYGVSVFIRGSVNTV